MIDASIAFDNYIKKLNSIENAPDIKKPAKVDRDDFDDDVTYYLAKAEEAKALELFKEEVKNKRIKSKQKKDEVEKEFKDILFSQYSEYSYASLEKVFEKVKSEEDQYNWLISFEEKMDFIANFIELNKI